jgi:hypothetical protein
MRCDSYIKRPILPPEKKDKFPLIYFYFINWTSYLLPVNMHKFAFSYPGFYQRILFFVFFTSLIIYLFYSIIVHERKALSHYIYFLENFEYLYIWGIINFFILTIILFWTVGYWFFLIVAYTYFYWERMFYRPVIGKLNYAHLLIASELNDYGNEESLSTIDIDLQYQYEVRGKKYFSNHLAPFFFSNMISSWEAAFFDKKFQEKEPYFKTKQLTCGWNHAIRNNRVYRWFQKLPKDGSEIVVYVHRAIPAKSFLTLKPYQALGTQPFLLTKLWLIWIVSFALATIIGYKMDLRYVYKSEGIHLLAIYSVNPSYHALSLEKTEELKKILEEKRKEKLRVK